MRTTISAKGQLVLPAELREQDEIEPSQEFKIERLDRGEYRLLRTQPAENAGLVDWLCGAQSKTTTRKSSRNRRIAYQASTSEVSGRRQRPKRTH